MHGEASAGDPWARQSPAECFGFSFAFVFQQKSRPPEDVRAALALSLSRALALPPSSHACEQRARVHNTSVPRNCRQDRLAWHGVLQTPDCLENWKLADLQY